MHRRAAGVAVGLRWNRSRRGGGGCPAGPPRRGSRGNGGGLEGGPEAKAAPDKPTDGRARALAILGLSEGASADDMRSAYRRLAKVRHPDRFAQLGPSAVAAATESFKVLQGAYELLGG